MSLKVHVYRLYRILLLYALQLISKCTPKTLTYAGDLWLRLICDV